MVAKNAMLLKEILKLSKNKIDQQRTASVVSLFRLQTEKEHNDLK